MRDGQVVGTVAEVSRFAVKSTAGESLQRAAVDRRGLLHDRQWAAYTEDGGIASGKTTRRFRKVAGLLAWRSSLDPAGVPLLHAPGGGTYPVDGAAAAQALSRAFGRPLTLRREAGVSHYDECGVHLVTKSSIARAERLVGGRVDVGRLRGNFLLDTGQDDVGGFVEDAWTGADLLLGPEVVLRLGPGMPRCVMVDQPQDGIGADPPLLKALGREHELLLGLQAQVVHTGTVTVGDEVRLRAAHTPA